ncbi:unnamed protein product [Ambrosiozyma monospora]|uniref:Unnamed protein product n=1 Tax=Ambrosiozyma monospora TaxID=43982 RepID=A0A9W7DH26_AMBMO|nr:unnamed protein product [Ambrosiozyma monospora]
MQTSKAEDLKLEPFCEFVSSVFADLQFVKFFLDDAIIVSNTPEEHLEHLKIVLTRLTENKLHLNVEKSHFFQTTVDWVGHSISASPEGIISISPLDSTIETIKNFPRPTCKKDIQTFLGHLAYISEFIPHYADLTAPLSSLLGKDVRFSWTDECQSAFTNLIALEAKQMSLHPFSPSLPIKLTTDASKKAQLNWSTLEKELYAIKYAVERFKFGDVEIIKEYFRDGGDYQLQFAILDKHKLEEFKDVNLRDKSPVFVVKVFYCEKQCMAYAGLHDNKFKCDVCGKFWNKSYYFYYMSPRMLFAALGSNTVQHPGRI